MGRPQRGNLHANMADCRKSIDIEEDEDEDDDDKDDTGYEDEDGDNDEDGDVDMESGLGQRKVPPPVPSIPQQFKKESR